MARILWLGDAGCHTGFGRVTHSIGDRLVEQYNHDVSVLAVNYRGDYFETKMKLYRPNTISGEDTYGQTRFLELLGKTEPDVVVILQDPYVIVKFLFENRYDPDRILLRYRPLLTYIPVDGYNQPPGWFTLLPKVSKAVAMSNFGAKAIGIDNMVHHGVDTDQFWPISDKHPATTSTGIVCKSKADCKEAFGYPRDSFLVLRIDKNSGRKDFPATWKALVPVMRKHKDIIVHFHCESVNSAHGINMPAMFSRDEDTASRFYLPDFHNSFIGWPQQDLNILYNAADIFVSTSRGEGFGLTLAESLAAGVPVIAQNITAIPEVVGPGGVLIEPTGCTVTVPSGQDLYLADTGKFTEAIEHLYLAGGVRRKLGEAGREHVVKSFSWDNAAARFNEYVEELKNSTTETLERNDDAVPVNV